METLDDIKTQVMEACERLTAQLASWQICQPLQTKDAQQFELMEELLREIELCGHLLKGAIFLQSAEQKQGKVEMKAAYRKCLIGADNSLKFANGLRHQVKDKAREKSYEKVYYQLADALAAAPKAQK